MSTNVRFADVQRKRPGGGGAGGLRVDIIPLWVRRAHLLTGQPTRAAGVHLHQGLACAYLCLLLRERCECSPSC